MQRDEIDRYEVGPFEIVAYATPDLETSFEEWQEPTMLGDDTGVHEWYAERKSTFGVFWWLVGVEVEAKFNIGGGESILLGQASLWGVESDAQEEISDEIIPQLAEEAIIEAKTHLRKIEESLKAIHLDTSA